MFPRFYTAISEWMMWCFERIKCFGTKQAVSLMNQWRWVHEISHHVIILTCARGLFLFTLDWRVSSSEDVTYDQTRVVMPENEGYRGGNHSLQEKVSEVAPISLLGWNPRGLPAKPRWIHKISRQVSFSLAKLLNWSLDVSASEM